MTQGRPARTDSALLRLIRQGSGEEVVAAAIVIGALDLGGPRVVRTLKLALQDAEAPLRPYLLQALGRLSDPGALAVVAPFLLIEGALREQAVRIFCEHPGPLIPLLRQVARKLETSRLQPLVWVLVQRPDEEALAYLLELLKRADFEGSKMLYLAVRTGAAAWKRSTRRTFTRLLCDHLDTLSTRETDLTCEIACIKLLSAVGTSRAFGALLQRVVPGRPPVVRHNALEAMAELTIPRQRQASLARTLLPILADVGHSKLAASALRILLRLDPPVVDEQTLSRLAKSPDPDLASRALLGLGRSRSPALVTLLVATLERKEAQVRAAAARSLESLPEAMQALMAAHADSCSAGQRDQLSAILRARSARLSPQAFAQLARRSLDRSEDQDSLRESLLLLGHMNEAATSRQAETRAIRALDSQQPQQATELLEPLVRARLATPRGRYLLAIARLLLADPAADQPGRDELRALQLLGPLSRLEHWKLHLHLSREGRLDAARRQHLLAILQQRSEAERCVATYVARRWKEPLGIRS